MTTLVTKMKKMRQDSASNENPNDQLKRLLKEAEQEKKKSKYGNHRIEREGVWYDSEAEYRFKGKLDMEVKAGIYTGYDYHVQLPLIAGDGVLIGFYEADFIAYKPDGCRVIFDVKSIATKTSLFIWKAKHVLAQYGDYVHIVDSKTL